MKHHQWDFHHYLQRSHTFILVYTSSNLRNIAIGLGGVHIYFEDVLVRICIFFLFPPSQYFTITSAKKKRRGKKMYNSLLKQDMREYTSPIYQTYLNFCLLERLHLKGTYYHGSLPQITVPVVQSGTDSRACLVF